MNTRVEDLGDADPRLYVRVGAMLRQQIQDGTLGAGRAVPSITTLIGKYGHDRRTYGTAMRTLKREGLLVRIPGLGYHIAGPTGPRPAHSGEANAEALHLLVRRSPG